MLARPGAVFLVGTTTVACAATSAGTSSAASFQVTVLGAAEQIDELRAQVRELTDKRLVRILDPILRDAAAAVATGHIRACSRLAALSRAVQTHAGRRIASAMATSWIADASRIRDVISC